MKIYLKHRKRQKMSCQRGQSTVEFALTLILVLGIFFFYFQLCMSFAFGNWVHYATFMSARAYLSSGPNVEDQLNRATQVMAQMVKRSVSSPNLDRFPLFGKGVMSASGKGGGGTILGMDVDSPEYQKNNRTLSWLRGIRYTFKSRIFILPFAGVNHGVSDESLNFLKLTSESWLGKEPSYQECLSDLGEKGGGIFDNGC